MNTQLLSNINYTVELLTKDLAGRLSVPFSTASFDAK